MAYLAQKTFMEKAHDVERTFYLIDAEGQILGRLASQIAAILRGKHKPTYTPHVDTGDYVIVINAEKVRTTGKKLKDKIYQKYTGYRSGQKEMSLETMLSKNPAKVIELAVKRMIPSGALGSQVFRKLKVYTGSEHPHTAQNPVEYKLGDRFTIKPKVVVKKEKPVKPAPVKAKKEAKAETEDLTKVEGIGPKYCAALNDAGITTFAQIAASNEEALTKIVKDAGMRTPGSIGSWTQQAKLAADGKWDELEKLQEELIGGR